MKGETNSVESVALIGNILLFFDFNNDRIENLNFKVKEKFTIKNQS